MGWLLKLATGNPITLLYLAGAIALASAAAGGSAAWWLQGLRLDSAKAKTVTVQAAFDGFKVQVKANGEIAQKAARAREEADLKLAKEKDADHVKALKNLDSQYAAYRLRVRAGSGATISLLPKAAPGTGSSDAICYSRNSVDLEITEALGRLRAGIADDSEPYDQAAVMARTCQAWAAGR